MKVYHMYIHNRRSGRSQTLGIFDKPKTARKFIDKRLNTKTKGHWKKCEGGARRFEFADFQVFIEESRVIKEKETP